MKPTHTFQAENITAGYDQKTILKDISVSIPSNKISIIIGANGCGKSTLLKTMARLIKPTAGQVTLDGKPITKIPPKQLARVLGLLPQSPVVPEGIAVASGEDAKVYDSVLIAQTADILLTMKDVGASFVIAHRNDGLIGISARSLGEVNVQLVMEKLGGGGHLTNAATQIEANSIDEVKKYLNEAIGEIVEGSKES